MIIDAHAHLVAPDGLYAYRALLLADGGYHSGRPKVSDDDLAASAADNVAVMDSVELLLRTVGPDRVLFGAEKPGIGSSAPNPDTGRDFDDLRPVIEGFGFLSEADRTAVLEDNARTVFPALDKALGRS